MLSALLKQDLIDETDMEVIFQRHIIEANSFFFNEFKNIPEQEYELRKDLSRESNINIRDTLIVGSAQIGFSIKTREFVEFDSKFKSNPQNKNKSDIDIAIVSPILFDELAEKLYKFTRHYDKSWIAGNWLTNAYYPLLNKEKPSIHDSFFYYYAKGWFRPDYIPSSFDLPWKPVVERWRSLLKRKISIGLYRDWKYLKNYQTDHLETIRAKIKAMEI